MSKFIKIIVKWFKLKKDTLVKKLECITDYTLQFD